MSGAIILWCLFIGGSASCSAEKAPGEAGRAAAVGIEQESDVWWFTSPAGKRFLSIGMNHVEPVYWTSPNNKQFVLETYGRDLFLPDGQFNDGSEAARKWAGRVAANLKAWGFNTLGMHNPPLESLRSAGDAYYVVNLGVSVPWGWNMKRSELTAAFTRRPLDVFGDAFAAQVQSNAEQWVKPHVGDPRVLGYAYTDGPPWTVDDDSQDAGASLHPWVLAIMSLPAQAKGKQAWLATMKERYPSAAAAGATYGRNTPTWDELASVTAWDSVSSNPTASADSQAFLEKLVRQWYELRRNAIRQHDKHHLILGDKLNTNRDARHREGMIRSLRVMKEYVDVIFIQYYAPADEQRGTLAAIYEAAQKPILIGDTACRPLWKDNDLTDVGYYGELGQAYVDDLTKLFSLPYLIGWHHCGYMRGLRPPYVAALQRGDQQTIAFHEKTKTTLREGFITELEAPIDPILKPLSRAISQCETLHGAFAPADRTADIPGVKAVLAHIQRGFPQSVKVDKKGDADIVALPHPYTSPCVKEGFQQLFYWDTYFINQGMLRVGMAAQARHNTDNLLFLLGQFGVVPSANRRSMSNRSQTPFLAQMVRDVYENQPDDAWLKSAHTTLKKEYDFWMTRRLAPCGLNCSGNDATEQYLMAFYHYLARERFKGLALASKEEQLAFSRQALSEAETWDFTPRYDRRAEDFCPVDLNSNLYTYEMNFACFSKILHNGEEPSWLAKAEKRKTLIQELLWNAKLGCYVDYDWRNRRQGDLVSCAALFPLVAGIASPQQAEQVVRKMRDVLEFEHGLATCEKRTHPFVYQWDYPNAWPPLQMLAIQALDRYGHKADARRVAEKYVRTVVRNFQKSGDLWEKYNAVTGTIEVKDEYQMPRMMGWTAGVFVFAAGYLEPVKAGGARRWTIRIQPNGKMDGEPYPFRDEVHR